MIFSYRMISMVLLFSLSMSALQGVAHAHDDTTPLELKLGAISDAISFDQALRDFNMRKMPSAPLRKPQLSSPKLGEGNDVEHVDSPQEPLYEMFSSISDSAHRSLSPFGSPQVVIRSLSPVKLTFLFTFNFGEV